MISIVKKNTLISDTMRAYVALGGTNVEKVQAALSTALQNISEAEKEASRRSPNWRVVVQHNENAKKAISDLSFYDKCLIAEAQSVGLEGQIQQMRSAQIDPATEIVCLAMIAAVGLSLVAIGIGGIVADL